MKILKVFGIVVGIHVFALILIFANPGCTSTAKPAPAPADTTAKAEAPAPAITVPAAAPADSPVTAAPTGFDPNAPAVAYSPNIRFSPTRPGTAAAGALEAQPVADVIPATTYTVEKGDSLGMIARKNHLTRSELAAANNLKPDATIRIGQKPIIPGKVVPTTSAGAKTADAGAAKVATAEPAAAPKGPADAVKHVVKPGETLGAIARKYQVKMGDIATANNITDPKKLQAGTELIIPGWQTPGGKSAKSGAKTAGKPATDSAAPPVIPTISVTGETPETGPGAKPAADAPPVISVEEASTPKKP